LDFQDNRGTAATQLEARAAADGRRCKSCAFSIGSDDQRRRRAALAGTAESARTLRFPELGPVNTGGGR